MFVCLCASLRNVSWLGCCIPSERAVVMSPSALLCPLWSCVGNAVWVSWVTAYRKHYGTSFGTKYWLNNEPCGLFTASMTQFFISGGAYMGCVHVIWPWLGRYSVAGVVNTGIFLTFLFLGALSHLKCMFTDPGAVPKEAMPLPQDMDEARLHSRTPRKCQRSGIYKPPRAHFDSGVQRNVIKMDHHCPWVNNTVGVGNHKYFMLFCLYISLASWYAIGLMVTMFFGSNCHANNEEFTPPHCQKRPENVLFITLLFVESALFGLFTMCMLCDQVHSVMTNTTYIDRLKEKPNHRRVGGYWKNFFHHMSEVVGDKPKFFDWFLPTKPEWHDMESLYGFCMPGSERSRIVSFRMLSTDSEFIEEA